MPSLSSSRVNSLMLVVLLFAQLLLMAGSVRRRDGTTSLEGAVMWLTSPVVRASGWIGGGVRNTLSGIRGTFGARAANERLRRENLELRSQVVRLREAEVQNRRLRRLLGMREDLAPQSLAARVVGARIDDQAHVLVLDRGIEDGVRVDDAVVAWGGAIGRVIYADGHFCKVRLLTDPNSGVAAVIQRGRTEGMLLGQGGAVLDMAYVSRFADVALGDTVVTSGLDGLFPPGLTIGRVTFAGTGDEVSRVIHVTPAIDAASVEEVLVLLEPTGGELLPVPQPEVDR